MLSYDPSQFRILCVEDEQEILADIAEELRDHGFQIEQAANARDALAIAEQATPDLIVCDMLMPGMSGLEFLQILRARKDGLGSVPFVFLTAYGDRESMLNGRRGGADDYLVKPVDYDLLIATVESHLHNVARRQELSPTPLVSTASLISAGPEELQARVATLSHDHEIAVIAIDNISEVIQRLRTHGSRGQGDFVRRLLRRSGVEAYRLNSRKFALLGPPVQVEHALHIFNNVTFRDPHAPLDAQIIIRASIVTASPGPELSGPELITAMADAAHLLQREGGGRRVALEDRVLDDMRLAGAIRARLANAVRQGELHICLQPQVRADTGEHVGAEVLVRWVSPLLGYLPPATFIPVAEQAGLLPHVTDWVLRQAAICQQQLVLRGLPARLAVNIGASEFNLELPERIARACAGVNADPRLIEVEITETTVLANMNGAREVSLELHRNGMAIALDDFGTGFSSLDHLRQCQVDIIKIDRSFIEQITQCKEDAAIVDGIIHLAASLGLATVAEGVETEEQQRWLTERGCEIIQGYLIARPLPFDEYCQWSVNRGKGTAA